MIYFSIIVNIYECLFVLWLYISMSAWRVMRDFSIIVNIYECLKSHDIFFYDCIYLWVLGESWESFSIIVNIYCQEKILWWLCTNVKLRSSNLVAWQACTSSYVWKEMHIYIYDNCFGRIRQTASSCGTTYVCKRHWQPMLFTAKRHPEVTTKNF